MPAKRNNNVYILGAGFSADGGVPMMNSFLQSLRQYAEDPTTVLPEHLDEHYDRVLAFRHQSKRVRDSVEVDLENIEELFSLASVAAVVDNNHAEIEESIRHIIAHTVTRTAQLGPVLHVAATEAGVQAASQSSALLGLSSEVLDFVPDNNLRVFNLPELVVATAIFAGYFDVDRENTENTFISFNYDPVVEMALAQFETRPNYLAEHLPYQGAHSSWPVTLPLIKLHGSSTWADVPIQNVRGHVFDSYLDYSSQRVPILVPPTWKKGELGNLFSQLWGRAHHALVQATRIVVVGYSAPATDLHFKHLLASALADNPSLYQLVVVTLGDEDSNPAISRFREMFSPLERYGRLRFHHDGLLQYLLDREFLAVDRGSCIQQVTSP